MDTILLIVIVGLVIFFLWGKRGDVPPVPGGLRGEPPSAGPPAAGGSSNTRPQMVPYYASPQESRRDELYRQLLNQVLGDRGKAQRLIAFERSKDPRLTEEQCIERASLIIEKDITQWD